MIIIIIIIMIIIIMIIIIMIIIISQCSDCPAAARCRGSGPITHRRARRFPHAPTLS
jgi:hypothetical protein